MCGRYVTTADAAELAAELDAVDETRSDAQDLRPEEAGPNFNVAPTTKVLTVVREDAVTSIRRMRWGLIPGWAKTPKGKPLINARSESVATSPAFRASLSKRRCLVPMDGWYEWRLDEVDGKAVKVPFYMTPMDGSRLYAAGLWSVWRDGDAPALSTCTILTTDALGGLESIHQRMPVLLGARQRDQWMDATQPAPDTILADPEVVAQLELRQVSTAVNKVANNSPDLVSQV